METANPKPSVAPNAGVPAVRAPLPPPNADSPDKERLECEKLKAEIHDILKPVWKKTAFYSAVAPIALAILGLLFTWGAGWFDVQRTRISNNKALLEAQTERLKTERTILESQTRDQQARFTRAESEIDRLRQHESQLTNQVARLERDREDLRLAKDLLENQTKRLAGSDAKALELLEQVKTFQATRKQLADSVQMLETSNATLRATTVRQAALISWANEVLSEGWRIALKDKATWVKFQDYGQHVMNVRIASADCLPEWQVERDPASESGARAVQAYDNDYRVELRRMLSEAAKKRAEDFYREAEKRFQLLNDVTNQTKRTD